MKEGGNQYQVYQSQCYVEPEHPSPTKVVASPGLHEDEEPLEYQPYIQRQAPQKDAERVEEHFLDEFYGLVSVGTEHQPTKAHEDEYDFGDGDEGAFSYGVKGVESFPIAIDLVLVAEPTELVSTGAGHVGTPGYLLNGNFTLRTLISQN